MADRSSQEHIPERDGLRGIAILLVVAAHYFAVPGTGAASLLSGYWFRLGWTGVDLFFVLSGFLIGGILLGARGSPNYFKTFYARRFFRIIPLYYAWIVLYAVLAVGVGSWIAARIGTVQGIGIALPAHFLFLQNFHDFTTSTVFLWWFSSTWSLAVEEQFYLVAPLVVRYVSRRRLAAVLVIVGLSAPAFRFLIREELSNGPWLAYRLMPCRADSLGVGMLAALVWTNPRSREWLQAHSMVVYGVVAALFAGVAYLWRSNSDPLQPLTQIAGYSWLALFYAAILLLVLSRRTSMVAAVMRLGFLRELGGVSYCIYLVHESVFLFCNQMILHTHPLVTDAKAAGVTLIAALVTYAIAKVSWRFLEQPLLRRGRQFQY